MLLLRIEDEDKVTMLYNKAIRILEYMVSLNTSNSSKIIPHSPTNNTLCKLSYHTTTDDSSFGNTDNDSWNSGNPFYDEQ
jgi:hypothetical protein